MLVSCKLLFAAVYAGAQLLVLSGVHRDVDVNQYGVGGGPLFEARAAGRRVALHLEGVPVLGIPTRASAQYGQATPSLGIVNSEAEFAVDRAARLWVGAGFNLYNQRTPLPALSQEVSSRLMGVRYTVRYRVPLRATHFFEANVGLSPSIYGTDRYKYGDGTPPVNKAERAAELDASVAFGVRRGGNELLFGLRTLNFNARFVKDNSAADRNVGTGLMFEWRHFIRG